MGILPGDGDTSLYPGEREREIYKIYKYIYIIYIFSVNIYIYIYIYIYTYQLSRERLRPDGHIFDREAILECLLQQKLDIQERSNAEPIMVEFQIRCGFKFEFMPFLRGGRVPGCRA